MELDKFITESLNSIIKGVNESKKIAKANDAVINPHIGKWDFDKFPTTYILGEQGARAISKIDFDIAVTASSEKDKAGGLGINVFSANLGGKISKTDLSETISRIKFSVNAVLPNTDTNK